MLELIDLLFPLLLCYAVLMQSTDRTLTLQATRDDHCSVTFR